MGGLRETPMVDGFRYPLATRRPHVTTPDSRTDEDEVISERLPFYGSPFYRYSGYGSKVIVCKSYAGVRGAYERRTPSTRTITRTVNSLRVCSKFRPSLLVFPRSLRFSSCPRVTASPQAGTTWMETLPSRGGFHHHESGSSGTAWFRSARAALLAGLRGLRFELLYFCGVFGADALGHTGSLLGCSEQGVLIPEGSQARVKEFAKSIPPNTEKCLRKLYVENDDNNMSNETKRETNYSMNNK